MIVCTLSFRIDRSSRNLFVYSLVFDAEFLLAADPIVNPAVVVR